MQALFRGSRWDQRTKVHGLTETALCRGVLRLVEGPGGTKAGWQTLQLVAGEGVMRGDEVLAKFYPEVGRPLTVALVNGTAWCVAMAMAGRCASRSLLGEVALRGLSCAQECNDVMLLKYGFALPSKLPSRLAIVS